MVYLLGEDRGLSSTASLTRLVPDVAAGDVYLCGPPGMADATRRALLAGGLPASRLHEERFAF